MLTSFISKRPNTDQRKQFSTVAKVNGSGMLFADFVFKTTFKAAKGEPNMATQNRTATFPTIDAGSLKGERKTTKNVAAITMTFTFACWRMDPGKVGAFFGEYFAKLKK